MIKIIQPAGLGDILFCIKIACTQDHDEAVIWPICEQYSYLPEKIVTNRPILFRDVDSPNCKILQLDGQNGPAGVMIAKYQYAKRDRVNWPDYWNLRNNHHLVSRLRDILGITPGTDYVFIQDTYGTPPNEIKHPGIARTLSDIISPDIKQIRMSHLEGFTPFEWAAIAANAAQLIITDSCLQHILEKYSLRASPEDRHVFCRSPESRHAVSSIFTHRYNYHA